MHITDLVLVVGTVCVGLCVGLEKLSPSNEFSSPLIFDKNEHPLTIPLSINVALVGFDGNGGHRFAIPPNDVEALLTEAFGEHQPSCVQTGEKLHVQSEIWYNVVSVHHSYLERIEAAMKKNMVKKSEVTRKSWKKKRTVGMYELEIQGDVENEINRMYLEHANNLKSKMQPQPAASNATYTIFFLNPSKIRMVPDKVLETKIEKDDTSPVTEEDYFYRYTYGGMSTGGMQTWVGSKRYVVADISAGPTEYGNANVGEGSFVADLLPILTRYIHESPDKQTEFNESHKWTIAAKISAVVQRAIQYVFFPDIAYESLDFSERVLIPIIVFRDHSEYSLTDGMDPLLDIEFIRTTVQRLALPNQKVTVVNGAHSIYDHEHIAVALARATRSNSAHEVSNGRFHFRDQHHVDGSQLASDMRHAQDILAAGLLLDESEAMYSAFYPEFLDPDALDQEAKDIAKERETEPDSEFSDEVPTGKATYGHDLPKKLKRDSAKGKHKRAIGTRVLPVYVFSLEQSAKVSLFKEDSPYYAAEDCVFVIQSKRTKPVPFFSGRHAVYTDLTNATQHVVAGLATSFSGITAPMQRFSPQLKRSVANFMWAHGDHPFGAFTNTSQLSQIYIDMSLRNSILSRMDASLIKVREAIEQVEAFAQRYVYDPFGETVHHTPKSQWWFELLLKQGNTHQENSPLAFSVAARLHQDIMDLENLFVQAAHLIYYLKLGKAHKLTKTIFIKASLFNKYVNVELHQAEQALACCSLQHKVVAPSHWVEYLIVAGIGIAAASVALIYYGPTEVRRQFVLLSPQRSS